MMLIVSTASDEQLLVATPSDPESFGVFYDRHHLAVLGALRQRAGGIEIALDVAAEVFAAAAATSFVVRRSRPGKREGMALRDRSQQAHRPVPLRRR